MTAVTTTLQMVALRSGPRRSLDCLAFIIHHQKRNRMRSIFIILCSLAIAAAAQAQILHVPDPTHPTIQSGINDHNFDTIVVSEGTYFEQINFIGRKPLMVASQFILDGDTSHIGKTILDGSQITSADSGSIVYFISGEDTTSVLCGFTLRNGNTGTAALHPMGGSIQSGGAVYIFGSGAMIRYNHISQNTINGTGVQTSGAGVSAGQWWQDSHWVVIDHNTIDHNTTTANSDITFGSGICVTCNSRITNNLISDNLCHGTMSSANGGAGFLAGGESFWSELYADIRNNRIINNQAVSDNAWAGGGAGVLQYISAAFTGNIVENNSANAAAITSTSGGGIIFWGPRSGSSLSGNMFRNNATSGAGGAISMEYDSQNIGSDTVRIENNYFLDNEALYGGAVRALDNPVIIRNNVFGRNYATSQGGAVQLYFTLAHAGRHGGILINNSFYSNKADQRGGALYSVFGNPLVINSVFWGDSSNAQYGPEIFVTSVQDTAEIAYSDINAGQISGPWTDGGGNLDQDPLYSDPDSLTISHESPCYNAGTPQYVCLCGMTHESPGYDIKGIPRPSYGAFDMGAHEFKAPEGTGGHKQGSSLSCRVSPNPVNSLATITYTLAVPCNVTITVFSSFGERLATLVNAQQRKGDQQVNWDMSPLPSGIYLYRIEAGKAAGTGKILKL
jgi:hypothetical protein